jgi:hypothetical protein
MNFPLHSLRPLFFTTVLCAILMLPCELSAFGGTPGGPFGNGSYFSNNGTFSAVVRGTNLSGTMQFSTTDSSGPERQEIITGADGAQQIVDLRGGVGSTGVAYIYYNGTTYNGNSKGAYNPSSSTLDVNFEGSGGGLGLQDIVVNTLAVTSTSANSTTFSVTPIKTILYRDSDYLNGYANCVTSNAFPNQKFSGTGEVKTQYVDFANGNSDPRVVVSEPVDIRVSGVRVSNSASSFRTSLISPPSVNTVTTYIQP